MNRRTAAASAVCVGGVVWPAAVVNGSPYLGEQGGLGEWLFQQVDIWVEGALGVQNRLGVAGHVQDRQARAGGADPRGDLVAEHARHDHVGEQQVDGLGGVGGLADGVGAGGGGADLVAVAGQDAAGQLPQALLVFDQEDSLAAA